MAASVGWRCLRLLRGVTPWRSRYSYLGRLSKGGRRPGPPGGRNRLFFCGLDLRRGRVKAEPSTFT